MSDPTPPAPSSSASLSAPPSSRRRLALILALSFVAVAAFQGTRGLYETTEGRYAECARETFASANLRNPILFGKPHWTKPPLTYWAIGAGMEVLGTNTWGARAFLILTFVGTVAAVYFQGRRMWRDDDSAHAGALVYATSLVTLAGSNMVSTDSLLTFWIALGSMAFWWYLRSGHWAARLGFWLAFACAFMTKGPPALLPLLGILPAYFAMRHRSRVAASAPPNEAPLALHLFEPLSILAFFAVGFGWYIIEVAENPGLWRTWLVDETIARNVAGKFHRNSQWFKGFAIYWPLLLAGHLPWTVYLLARRRMLATPSRWWRLSLRGRSPEELYLILCFLLPLLVFMVSTLRLPLYILPLFIPLSLAVGRGVALLVARGGLSLRMVRVTALALFCIFVAGKGLVSYRSDPHDMGQLANRVLQATGGAEDATYYLLYDSQDNQLPGLMFHLRTTVTLVQTGTEDRGDLTPGALPARLAEDAAANRHPFVIASHGHLDRVALRLDLAAFDRHPIDKSWDLLVPRQDASAKPE